jgi:hypothetical protein
MGRLKRFDDYRFLGRRDLMRVYDCDDPDQFAALEAAENEMGLMGANMIQTFAPDTPAEALSRGFRPADI